MLVQVRAQEARSMNKYHVTALVFGLIGLGFGLTTIDLLRAYTNCWCKFDCKRYNEPPLN